MWIKNGKYPYPRHPQRLCVPPHVHDQEGVSHCMIRHDLQHIFASSFTTGQNRGPVEDPKRRSIRSAEQRSLFPTTFFSNTKASKAKAHQPRQRLRARQRRERKAKAHHRNRSVTTQKRVVSHRREINAKARRARKPPITGEKWPLIGGWPAAVIS